MEDYRHPINEGGHGLWEHSIQEKQNSSGLFAAEGCVAEASVNPGRCVLHSASHRWINACSLRCHLSIKDRTYPPLRTFGTSSLSVPSHVPKCRLRYPLRYPALSSVRWLQSALSCWFTSNSITSRQILCSISRNGLLGSEISCSISANFVIALFWAIWDSSLQSLFCRYIVSDSRAAFNYFLWTLLYTIHQ